MASDGLDPGLVQPAPSALNYMTVPEKIELTERGSGGGYSSTASTMEQSGYRPMKVPDMITLEQTSSPVRSAPSEGMRDQPQMGRWRNESGARMASEPISQVQQAGLPPQPQEVPVQHTQVQDHHPAIADLDRRVKTLEQQVQRLKDVAVSRGGPAGPARQGNNFWYVLTFAGWMMIPLVLAYMYRYRRY